MKDQTSVDREFDKNPLLFSSEFQKGDLIKDFDVVSLPDLVVLLRQKLSAKDINIVVLADSIGCSKSFLYDFRNGKAVCMDILNRLANYFRIKYFITNYEPKDLDGIAWKFPSERNSANTS